MKLSSFISTNRIYFVAYMLSLAVMAALYIFIPKGAENIWFDQHRNFFFDRFFSYYTNVGDGLFFLGVCLLLLLFGSYRNAITGLLIFAGSGLTAQLLKRWIIGPVSRPSIFLKDTYTIKGAEGVELLQASSFPSGHSTTAFALCMFLAYITPVKYTWLWLFIALLAGFSRIYLCQHFLVDVLAGATLGGLISLLIQYVCSRWKWLQQDKMNKSLLR